MTLFEYITVAVSLFLALSIARTLDGVRYAFDPSRMYWVHTVWVILKLSNPVLIWWAIWGFNESAWNLSTFAWTLCGPGLLYLQVTSLVTRHPESVLDWQVHFYDQSREFFALNVSLSIWSITLTRSLIDVDPTSQSAVALYVIAAFSLLGAISKNRRIHGVIAVLAMVNFVLGLGVALFRPGPGM